MNWLDEIEKAAKAAHGHTGRWYPFQRPWFEDDAIGVMADDPDPHKGRVVCEIPLADLIEGGADIVEEGIIYAHSNREAKFIAAANPAAILCLIAKLRIAVEALKSVEAALGDRLLAKGPLSAPYARRVMKDIDVALKEIEDADSTRKP